MNQQQQQANVDRNYLWTIFQQLDPNRSGHLDSLELQRALSNGTWVPFNLDTVRLLILMFDVNRNGHVDFDEFCLLWSYVTEWQNVFQRIDTNRSGNIDYQELGQALTSFGYRFSEGFHNFLIQRFDRTRSGSLQFDDFVQVCVMLRNVTEGFKKLDVNRQGVVTVTYEGYMHSVLSSQI